MKKIFKKLTVFICAMAVSIGAIGGSVDAASYMSNKTVDVFLYMNGVQLANNAGYVSVSTSNGTSSEVYVNGSVTKSKKIKVKVSAATKNSMVKFTVRYRIAGRSQISSRSVSVKASTVYSLLGGKNLNLNVNGNKLGDITSVTVR